MGMVMKVRGMEVMSESKRSLGRSTLELRSPRQVQLLEGALHSCSPTTNIATLTHSIHARHARRPSSFPRSRQQQCLCARLLARSGDSNCSCATLIALSPIATRQAPASPSSTPRRRNTSRLVTSFLAPTLTPTHQDAAAHRSCQSRWLYVGARVRQSRVRARLGRLDAHVWLGLAAWRG